MHTVSDSQNTCANCGSCISITTVFTKPEVECVKRCDCSVQHLHRCRRKLKMALAFGGYRCRATLRVSASCLGGVPLLPHPPTSLKPPILAQRQTDDFRILFGKFTPHVLREAVCGVDSNLFNGHLFFCFFLPWSQSDCKFMRRSFPAPSLLAMPNAADASA